MDRVIAAIQTLKEAIERRARLVGAARAPDLTPGQEADLVDALERLTALLEKRSV